MSRFCQEFYPDYDYKAIVCYSWLLDPQFKEFLRSNSGAVEKYSMVKEKAALLFPDDIDGYMKYKSSCIEELYQKCGLILPSCTDCNN